MAGKRIAVKTIDWVKLSSTIPKAAAADFNAFRVRHETVKGSLAALPEKPTPINWDFYAQNVKDAALVKKFQDAYSKVNVNYPIDTESSKIVQEEKEIETEIVEASKVRKAKIADLLTQVSAIKAQKPYEEMKTNEFMDMHPKLKAETDRELNLI